LEKSKLLARRLDQETEGSKKTLKKKNQKGGHYRPKTREGGCEKKNLKRGKRREVDGGGKTKQGGNRLSMPNSTTGRGGRAKAEEQGGRSPNNQVGPTRNKKGTKKTAEEAGGGSGNGKAKAQTNFQTNSPKTMGGTRKKQLKKRSLRFKRTVKREPLVDWGKGIERLGSI